MVETDVVVNSIDADVEVIAILKFTLHADETGETAVSRIFALKDAVIAQVAELQGELHKSTEPAAQSPTS